MPIHLRLSYEMIDTEGKGREVREKIITIATGKRSVPRSPTRSRVRGTRRVRGSPDLHKILAVIIVLY